MKPAGLMTWGPSITLPHEIDLDQTENRNFGEALSVGIDQKIALVPEQPRAISMVPMLKRRKHTVIPS